MLRFFNPEALRAIPSSLRVSPAGFGYGFVAGVFQEPAYAELLAAFPPPDQFVYHEDAYKRVFEGPYYDSHDHRGCTHHLGVLAAPWRQLLAEAASAEFIGEFARATGVAFNALRNFSFKYGRAGCEIRPHLDQAAKSGHPAASRLVSMWYFSAQAGPGPGGTAIYDRDRRTVLLEAPDLRNSMLFFEQHPEAWHGYTTITGEAERHALALTFNREPERIAIKDSVWHELFCLRRFSAPRFSPASKAGALRSWMPYEA